MDETKKWTNLTCAKIDSLLAEEGFKVSRNVVRKLLKKGLVQKGLIWGNKDNRRPALIFMRVITI